MERENRKMRLRGIAQIAWLALISAAVCLLSLHGAAPRVTAQSAARSVEQGRERHESYDLASGGVVSVNNTSGYIRVTSWNENRVKVDAVKRSRREEEYSQVEIQVTPGPGRIEIRTIYPREQVGGVSVDYHLKV